MRLTKAGKKVSTHMSDGQQQRSVAKLTVVMALRSLQVRVSWPAWASSGPAMKRSSTCAASLWIQYGFVRRRLFSRVTRGNQQAIVTAQSSDSRLHPGLRCTYEHVGHALCCCCCSHYLPFAIHERRDPICASLLLPSPVVCVACCGAAI